MIHGTLPYEPNIEAACASASVPTDRLNKTHPSASRESVSHVQTPAPPNAISTVNQSSLFAGTKLKGIGGHHRGSEGRSDEWLTPPEILSALGAFDLDPCSPVNRAWDTATTHYTIEDDGLCHEWGGRVFLNPPYGPETGKWLERLSDHGNGIALIFARTETDMFFRFVWERATAILFLRGRLHFHDITGKRADANGGAPSVLIAYGEGNAAILESCGINGKFMRLKGSPTV